LFWPKNSWFQINRSIIFTMRNHRRRKLLPRWLWLIGAGGLLLAAFALLRYGGPAALWQRAQTEVAAWKPHPVAVPTPLTDLRVDLGQMGQRGGRTLFVAHEQPTVLLPTVTPTPRLDVRPTRLPPTPTAEPTRSLLHPPAAAVELTGLNHFWQTWNNCGPATLATLLSYWGSTLGQEQIGAALRTHADDKNVMPDELAAYARNQGVEALVLVNGNHDILRLLLSNGLPVLVESWLEDEPNNGMGHYRLLTGYDDAARQWIAYDSYVQHNPRNPDSNGPYRGILIAYDEFDPLWKVFNRTYLVVYPPERAAVVAEILGADLDPQQMWLRAGQSAEQALTQNANDAFAWFNLGSALVALGRAAEAAPLFDHARQLGLPWRMLWYQFGPFEAYDASGRYQEVIALADATIKTTASVEELFYWRGAALAQLGRHQEAQQAWQRALRLNPHFSPAVEALAAAGN
jgi:tetratricopeptide (TPR) repeat protein